MPGILAKSKKCGAIGGVSARRTGRPVRACYLAFGWLCVALGVIGAVLPVMPTTIFLIGALWAFARGSEKYHQWLYSHPRFGPPLQRWTEYRVISAKAKMLACGMMAASVVYLVAISSAPVWVQGMVIVILSAVALYLLSRPSEAPQQACSQSQVKASD